MLLANSIHITRQLLCNVLRAEVEALVLARYILPLESDFFIQNTLPGVQHEFCDLWNEIVLRARASSDRALLLCILQETRLMVLSLHQGTDPAPTTFSASTSDVSILDQSSSYPLCNIPSHRSESASNLNEVGDGRTAETARTPIPTSPDVSRRDAVRSVIRPVTKYHVAPSPMSNLDHAIPPLSSLNEVPEMLQRITPVAASFHPTPFETDRFTGIAVAGIVQGTTDLSITLPMADTVPRPTSSRGATSRRVGNSTITIPPPLVSDGVP